MFTVFLLSAGERRTSATCGYVLVAAKCCFRPCRSALATQLILVSHSPPIGSRCCGDLWPSPTSVKLHQAIKAYFQPPQMRVSGPGNGPSPAAATDFLLDFTLLCFLSLLSNEQTLREGNNPSALMSHSRLAPPVLPFWSRSEATSWGRRLHSLPFLHISLNSF